MTHGERIRRLRKALDLTQREFADKIGMKPNTIATYEMGRAIPSNPTVNSICREYNVNEKWLRTGEGEMFTEVPETELDALCQRHDCDDLDRSLIEEYLKLDSTARMAIKNYLRSALKTLEAENSDNAEQ